MQEKFKLLAILRGRCPQCRKGKIFESAPYRLKKFTRINAQCPHCGVTYAKDPSFFYGAMYVSYSLNVALFLASAFILYQLFEPKSSNTYMIAIILEVILLYPLIFRYSRILFLYTFGSLRYKSTLDSKGNS